MKISKFFFSVIVLTSSVVFAGDKNEKNTYPELVTFYDAEIDGTKLVPFSLKHPYTSHVLRSIVRDTFDKGKLPPHAMKTFDNLLSFSPNFISLPSFLNQEILKETQTSDQADPSKVKALILISVNIACVENLQQYHQKKLADETERLATLQKQLKKLEN